MNSALQCMSNTPPLTDYFLSNQYMEDLNRENPLGMRGEIAIAYAEMIKALWSGCSQTFTPRAFKEKVGRFAPQFHGYMQQDCQELMSFLLDGLHEDLNRVKKKPYIEAKSADGRADRILAKEAWDNYLKRNDSIVTDTFHGLLKSTLVCPDCKHVSVTFDPSCFLSLPLPHRKDKLINAVIFKNESGKPSKLRVYVPVYPTKCTGNDFYSIVAKLTQLPAENLVAANMDPFDKRVKCIIEPNDDEIDDVVDTIYIYELPASPWKNEGSLIRVHTREIINRGSGDLAFPAAVMFGVPFYLYSPKRHITVDELYDMALGWLKGRYVNVDGGDGEADQVSDADDEPMDYESAGDEQATDKENSPPAAGRPRASQTAALTGTRRRKRLFKVNLVNEMCNTSLRTSNGEVQETASTTRVAENAAGGEEVFTLTPKAYVALDWLPKFKQAVYEECSALSVHPGNMTAGAAANKRPVRLWECLNLFTTTEKLGTEDLWYCPACKKHQQATKKFDLWSLPQVLIIHLKRFSYNRYFRDKIDTLVDFPITGLKMDSVVLNPRHKSATYDLIGVANHYGGMGGGHYTAYAKNKLTNTWHHFDDATVSSISESNIVSKNAYVLFYMRRDSTGSRSRSNGTEQAAPAASPAPNTGRPQRRSATQRNSSTSESEESISSNEESDEMECEQSYEV
ncbi:ubiquitin carboxyl-terminal hydrolase 4-like [Tropilaelaps mercedesae]|uniref:ubiquitinyl hydrolase 1 n=1 Tax=Tropilaelaps mercedesae TaxID=418985 RepID=A0A1V9XUK5_9ACAR|nr:ubiquitin carboxyl-terminal hydrolase 4-like [Tropilaelaps mercedesae]